MIGSITFSASVGGLSIQGNLQREDDGAIAQSPTLAAGKAGTLTTRTDDNTGVATLSAGHGIVTNDIVDVYWDGGRRYGMTASVSSNAVTVDGGDGDNLPAQSTSVVVSKVTTINQSFDGDNAGLVAVQSTLRTNGKSCVRFIDAGDNVLTVFDLVNDEPFMWWSNSSIDNPLSGNAVATIVASNGSSAASTTLKIGLVQDNVD